MLGAFDITSSLVVFILAEKTVAIAPQNGMIPDAYDGFYSSGI